MRISALIFCIFSITKLFSQTSDSPLKITHLTGDFFIYTTYNMYKNARIPANGLYVVSSEGVILIDTPWDTTQFQPLLDTIMARHHKKVTVTIATHFHEDRTGGLEYYKQKGIKTFTTKQTDELSKATGKPRAEFTIARDTVFTVGQYSFQTFYPGHGHTRDNIVIWFDQEKILYGGCLVKSTDDSTLGNLADANVKEYAATVRNVQKKCKQPEFIIPGHNSWASKESLNHTLKMALELAKENKR